MTRCLMKRARQLLQGDVGVMHAGGGVHPPLDADGARRLKMTPHERFFGWKPDLSHTRVFGCRVHVRLNVQGNKLNDRSKIGILVATRTGRRHGWQRRPHPGRKKGVHVR